MSKKILIIFPDSKGNDAITNFFAPTLGVIRIVSYLNNYNHEADYFDPNLFAVSHKGLSLEEKFLEKPISRYILLLKSFLEKFFLSIKRKYYWFN